MIIIRYKNLIIPFALLVMIVTLRVSSYINEEEYYDEFKEKFTKEVDIINLSKSFFGKLQFIYFEENDYLVSSNDVYTLLSDNFYYVSTDTNELISKNDCVVTKVTKNSITLSCGDVTITYYNLSNIKFKLYQFISAGEVIANIDYEYLVYYD